MLDVVEIKYIEKRCSQQFRRKWFLDGLHSKCTITFTGERHVISDICNILHNCSVCQCLVRNRLVTWQANYIFVWCFIYHQCGSPLCPWTVWHEQTTIGFILFKHNKVKQVVSHKRKGYSTLVMLAAPNTKKGVHIIHKYMHVYKNPWNQAKQVIS